MSQSGESRSALLTSEGHAQQPANMCLYPKLITNRKYLKNKKNGGIIPAVPDERVRQVPVGCGNCIECRKMKARNWTVRIMEDIKENKNAKLIVLTFSNESISELYSTVKQKIQDTLDKIQEAGTELQTDREVQKLEYQTCGYGLDNATAKHAVRMWLERWRKKYKKSLRHWLVSELGHEGTEHLHLHGIVWTNESLHEVEKTWSYGFVWKGKEIYNHTLQKYEIQNYVNEKTVNYIIKYVTKIDKDHQYYKPIVLCSAGIGKNYINSMNAKSNKYKADQTIETYRLRTGNKINLPIYYRNKLYTEQQKEHLWLMKLDKQERWILGEKISIAKTEEEYYKGLEYAQQRNVELGYGDDKKNWSREQYELERRTLKQQERNK
jgi:hypothetical protein